uniref:Reverse transcriptase domain-containing protein n=1 Tax=Cannabis sativa TaxID=3483 RepID=A0A803PCR1_CANSA
MLKAVLNSINGATGYDHGNHNATPAPRRRGRPRTKSPLVDQASSSKKRRGRPTKNKQHLGATPKAFKWQKTTRNGKEKFTTIKHQWEECGFSIWGYGDLPGKVSTVAMKILAWNCRGLGSTTTVRQLAALIHFHQPEMVLLSEVRLTMEKFKRITNRLHFQGAHYIPPIGQSGGLGLCWVKGVACTIISSNKFIIVGEITSDPPGLPWLLFGVYGPPRYQDKEAFWLSLGDATLTMDVPILVIGDLNGTLKDLECLNYANAGNSSRYAFDLRRMVNRVGLVDLGYQGPGFTWAKGYSRNMHSGRNCIKRARLDRGLATTDWRIQFPNAIVEHLSATVSDHRPILLDTIGGVRCCSRLFKYENMWARDKRCFWVVKEAWAKRLHHNPQVNFHRKVKQTGQKLSYWNKTQFKNVQNQVSLKRLPLQEVENQNQEDLMAIDMAKHELNEALLREEIHWKQKSRDCCDLSTIPSAEEIAIALNEMGKDKAPGPDGLPPSFYSHHWDVVKEDLIEMVTYFFNHGSLPHFINDTSFVLIPKKDGPAYTKDYRPIALCNVSYKLISKILANRMRFLLPRIVSPNQTALVKGRSITENTMIAREIVHSMKKKRGTRGFMMIKIDMEKAYDKLDWNFIIQVLSSLGFPPLFLTCIKACITVKEIKLLLNGSVMGKFRPSCGLRQGDPLSPTLFIIGAETLSRLFFEMENKNRLKGFKMGRQGDSVTHLMFADDIILFGQATLKEAKAFMDCLNEYCSWSGQSINLMKSSVTFTRGVPRSRMLAISQFLEMKRMKSDATYLGIPLFRSSKRTKDTEFIAEKVLQRVQGWKTKLLSSAGKSCLIKSVGSAISNYVVASDVIPLSSARKIDKVLRDFWWGDQPGRRVMHTIACDVLCRPKTCGGLGFRSTQSINVAFLMKWAWKALTDSNSLWSRVVNDKYILNREFMDLQASAADSTLWKAILSSRCLLSKGLCRRIGDGKTTSIWFHPWVPNGVLQPQPRLNATDGISLVENFIHHNHWNEALIRRWFDHDDAKRILNITLPSIPSPDSWLWLPEHNGKFSIKSAYRVVKNVVANDTNDAKWRIIWGANIHSRLKMLWWKILSNNLLTRSKLSSMFSIGDTKCPMCTLMDSNRPSGLTYNAFLEGVAIIFEKIWKERNNRIHHATETPMFVVLFHTNRRLMEMLNIHSRDHYEPMHCSPTVGHFATPISQLGIPWEVAALVWGAESAHRTTITNVVFLSDLVEAVNSVCCKTVQGRPTLLHHNIQDLVRIFQDTANQLGLWEVSWIPRRNNGVAHTVAKWALDTNQFGFIDLSNFDSSLLSS